ncbi:MAG: hypothetical protein KF799_14200 [Bdellovibrionales bacterium]|nr:hypothetical protein [Bdellovibrionales bacterium]
MSSAKWREGGIFVAGNLLAGLLNYLYQVVAARQLRPEDFADLNAWLAHIALFSVSAGLLQYAANFFPSRQNLLRGTIIAFNFIALLFIGRWFTLSGLTLERAIMIVTLASMAGWLLGQAQIRLAFIAMTVANIVLGLAKLTSAFFPIYEGGSLERFAFSLLFGYVPALWALTYLLWWRGSPERPVKSSWTAPVILSLTSVMIPQFDMIVMNHTQNPATFESFVKASLFYKSIYFWVYIGAQWLLPHQIQGGAKSTLRGLLLTFLLALIGCAGLTALSPFISTALLKWSEPPALRLVFLSCLHMSLLTMLFLWIQEMCAHRRPQVAALVLAVLAIEAASQWILRFPATNYLILVTVLQTCLLGTAYVLSGHLRPKRGGI